MVRDEPPEHGRVARCLATALIATADHYHTMVSDWLVFAPLNDPAKERVSLGSAYNDTVAASEMAKSRIRPALLDGRPVELDFARLDLCTQSWLHALLFEPMRLAWAMRVPIHVVNADPAVREGLRFLEAYALGG